jgi:hypothetical protein
MVYSPALSVVAARVNFVSVLMAVIVTLGTTALVGSVTVPNIVAVAPVWAARGWARAATAVARNAQRNPKCHAK